VRYLSTLLPLLGLAAPSYFAPSLSPSSQSFVANGVRIHYTVEGGGEPVVLIHGLGSSAWINWQLPGVVNLLSKNYKVIALDMPGHGESDKPDDDKAYGLQMVEDVVALLDHLDITN
jgi:pimeloyl-ACP methyl ester carboxylesterase